MQSIIQAEFEKHLQTVEATMNTIGPSLEIAAKVCLECLSSGGKILLFGNGGSAADAQHIAAEFVGRYKIERAGLAAIALTTDTSIITAVGNDYGYADIFSRQIEALANSNDVAIGISTSGKSPNVLSGLILAESLGCETIGMSGHDGGALSEICDINLVVPSDHVARVQEMHILIGHTICELIDCAYKNKRSSPD